ncbi:hypothetical protein BDU57DRAFT_241090 [Ampelomyces quisqualis]|uniref:Uncharacterized protein n=1 Tax=Ampelomyces quisqualis TaxID=50730 RepID=A0A6A5QPS3_AMPQU|nr:hypothetical protein BDU57DRAFT_241090 [Ampelomyces quisqualis]
MSTLMPPPPPPNYCAFGSECSSRDGGQEEGPHICSRCKNLSRHELDRKAINTTYDSAHLRLLVEEHFKQLKKEYDERVKRGWGFSCICTDPDYKNVPWRRHFDPEDSSPCGTVRNRGQLCKRCYTKAREQQCSFLIDFDGDREGFPCVWEDPRYNRPQDENWKRGLSDPNWQKDPRKHPNCVRPNRSNQLCRRCYSRMVEISGFGVYFCENSSTLHERWR